MSGPTRTRLTAAERSRQVIDAAVQAFAESGYAATKTDEIARRAGVSQPYVIRLFGTKQRLFLAALEQVCERIEELFRAAPVAPGDTPAEALRTLGDSYSTFLVQRELPLVLLHGAAAGSVPEIGDTVRERFGRIYRLISELTGASTTESRQFVATGMLLTMMTAMHAVGPDVTPPAWAAEIVADLDNTGAAPGEPSCTDQLTGSDATGD